MNNSLRFALTTPLAAIATLGLFVGMKALITSDFKPEKKRVAASFEINPKVIDIEPVTRVTKLAELKDIEIPPAPPETEKVGVQKPTIPIVSLDGKAPVLNPKDIKFDPIDIRETNTGAKPLVRIAAVMPPRAEKSGHCKVRFDVSPQGATFNIQTTYCSERIFERPTIKAVEGWKYSPKIRSGVAVTRTGVESTMSFNLTDEHGNIIPQ